MTDQERLELALDAVAHGALVCRHVQSQLQTVRAITKDDRSPVTVADFASQAVIAAMLREALGGYVLVGEESADFLRDPEHAAHLGATVAALHESGAWPAATEADVLEAVDLGAGDPRGPLALADGFWTIDPIDGTKGFLRKGQYAVSLGFVDARGPRVGVLGCPNLSPDATEPIGDRPSPVGCSFFAVRGEGAMQRHERGSAVIDVDIARRGLEPGAPVRLAESIDPFHTDQSASVKILAALGRPSVTVRLDSQAKYAVVARGQADAYLRLPTSPGYVERVWDHAAGVLIAREAGCVVTDLNGKPLDFSRGVGLESNTGVVCTAPEVHEAILRAVRSVGLVA